MTRMLHQNTFFYSSPKESKKRVFKSTTYISDDTSSVGGGVPISGPPPPRANSVMQREPGHLTPNHFARSSSLGGYTRAASNGLNHPGTGSSSLGQESGFQSCSSLVSLSQQKHSLFRGSPRLVQNGGCGNSEKAESSISGSMASLASGVLVPSLVNGMMRHSLNGGHSVRPESRISAISNSRRSARQLMHMPPSSTTSIQQPHSQQQSQMPLQQPLIDPNEHFSPVNQPHWVLKPLFFEVPQRDPNPIFVGRQWLYGEISEHLASNLPTNRGVVLSGNPGTGKTALLLKLVELSCFGRGEPIYQGRVR